MMKHYIFTPNFHYFVVNTALDKEKCKQLNFFPSLNALLEHVCETCNLEMDEVEGTHFTITNNLVLIDDRGISSDIETNCLETWIKDFQL